ncbi:MAG TPA: tetraacyldisaccharide 4'-kinase [Syntrophales bacterium]|nr:tetraacyldisaccharide 4'-kinase [Syntrophales bacterium]
MINWQNALRRVWDGDYKSWTMFSFFILLLVLSFPYRAVAACRNFLYDSGILPSKKLPCRVISIGNITTGGTGKTPTVIMLAIMLKAAGYRPAVLSRGYGRKNTKVIKIVSDGRNIRTDHDEAGDEAFLIAVMLPEIPIVVGSDRYLAGRRAIEEFSADILILDDGFQHRRLYRDIDILLLNHARPVGNSHLLPCGSLREQLKALKRADIVLLTGSSPEGNMGPDSPPPLAPFLHDFPNIFYGYHKPLKVISGKKDSLPPDWLKGKKIYAFAGIGAPLSFSSTIESLGGNLTGFLSFSDHHVFTAEDILTVRSEAERLHAEIILTTEKDGVRLRNFPDFLEDIFLLSIEMSIIGRSEAFYSLIRQKLAAS